MSEFEILEQKRVEVLEAIKPICELFNIVDYDYMVKEEGQTEILRLNHTYIGCSLNSIFAIKSEIIGYVFIAMWEGRMGAFEKQTTNRIKRYWEKEEIK